MLPLLPLQAAKMQATSEATLRSQAELATQQLQMQLSALEAEAAALRATNQVCSCAALVPAQ